MKPGKPSLGLRAFLDIKLDEYFPEIRPFDSSWGVLGEILDNMAELRDCSGLSDTQKMDFAFAALLTGSAETSLKFLERITNEVHLLKNVPLQLLTLQNLDERITGDIPAMRRLAVKLNGLRPLCLLVQSVPGRYYHSADFAKDLWKVASEYDLLEAAPQAYLTGKMLLDLGVKPGKQMGEIIKESFELQLDGKITTAEEAVEWARGIILPESTST